MSGRAPPLPRALQLEVTGACNLRCRMCLVRYRPPLNKADGAMPFELFKRIVDSLPELEDVTLQGLGEPLLAPDLERMVAYASARGARVGFNTNATLLDRERAAALIDAGLAWVCVSVDGATAATYEGVRDGGAFDRVLANLDGLLAERRARGGGQPTVKLVFVAMRRNVRELPALVRLAARLGVDQLWVQNLSHAFSDTDPAGAYQEIREFTLEEALWVDGDDPEATAAFTAAAEAAGEVGLDLRLPRRAPRPGRRAPGEPGCDWPWRAAYVNHDGTVQPCCMVMGADRAVLGDLRREGFPEVWHGEAYQAFRARLLSDGDPPEVCRGCSLYRGVF